jgi:hypothetical protein
MFKGFLFVYKYIYFHLYLVWSTKLYESGNSKLNAVFTLSLTLFFYLLGTAQILEHYKLEFWLNSWFISNEMLVMISVFSIFNVINWRYLGRKKEHDDIAKQFATYDTKERRLGMIASIALFFFALVFHSWSFSN